MGIESTNMVYHGLYPPVDGWWFFLGFSGIHPIHWKNIDIENMGYKDTLRQHGIHEVWIELQLNFTVSNLNCCIWKNDKKCMESL